MTLRLLIAFARWAWGIHPTFYKIEPPISDGCIFLMFIGVIIDLTIVCFLADKLTGSKWPYLKKDDEVKDEENSQAEAQ